MKKRILTLLLALALSVGLAAPALADKEVDLQGDYTSGAYTYDLNADGTATIISFNKDRRYVSGSIVDLVVPAELDGHKVTGIGSYSYSYYFPAGVQSITIPEGVEYIYDNAFLCPQAYPTVTELNLPSTLKHIGPGAFSNHTAIRTLVIPESVKFIGTSAFHTMDADETKGLQTVVCYSRDVEFEGASLYGSTAFESCRNAVFYGYPGSTTETLVNSYIKEYYHSTQQPDGSWKEEWLPTGNTFRDIADYGKDLPVEPEKPKEEPAPLDPASTAYASPCPVIINGASFQMDAYMLKDANGNGTNYLKLRDVAWQLSGTGSKFNVDWDQTAQAISITTGLPYTTTNGTEMSTPFSGDQPYEASTASVLVNGVKVDLEAIVLTDDSGAGYTYFKLRDLGTALGFPVDWDQESGSIVIDAGWAV